MKPTSLLFFSSSSIALPLFEVLLEDKRFKIIGLVCQPDKPAGRGHELTAPATKILAEKNKIPVFQPNKLSKDEGLLAGFKKNPPDFLLTFAYGQLLSPPWLSLPIKDPLNVHPSLLPKYRGPAPLEAALLDGEMETGITLIKMVEAMDAGPFAFQRSFALGDGMTVGELYDKVAAYAAEWIPDAIFALVTGTVLWQKQNESRATFSKKLTKEDSFENFGHTSDKILHRYAAYTPWPGLWTTISGKRLKLLKLIPSTLRLVTGKVSTSGQRLFIGTTDGSVEVLELQIEGKKACSAAEFLRGYAGFNGVSLPS